MFGSKNNKNNDTEKEIDLIEETTGLSDQKIEEETKQAEETTEKTDETPVEETKKEKKKKKTKDQGEKTIPENTERYTPDVREGLSTKQV